MTASNIIYEAGSSGDIVARNNIDILPESFFETTSEVHIFCGLDCPLFEDFNQNPSLNGNQNDSFEGQPSLTLNFKKEKQNIFFLIVPNPNSGKFTIRLRNQNSMNERYDLVIFDLVGQVVYHSTITGIDTQVNMPQQRPGSYFVRLINDKRCQTNKLIIEHL